MDIDTETQGTIALEPLSNGLNQILSTFSLTNYDILFPIFKDKYEEYRQIIMNVVESKSSDIILSYGNNNYVLKVFLDDILAKQQKLKKITYNTIKFNGYIHTTEEYVLKTLCHKLGVSTTRAGFDNLQRALETHFASKTQASDNKEIIVIYYENFEHLMVKRKQILLYTLLELINASTNILFIGFTANYNLVDQMEKRIRSRFSQKTIYITIPDLESVINGVEKLFTKNKITKDSLEIPTSMDLFFRCLVNEKVGRFIILLQKYIHLGYSIIEILTKIKYIITLTLNDLDSYLKEYKDSNLIEQEKVIDIINGIINDIIEDEDKGSYYNLLKNFPKLHITLLLCLCHCTVDFQEKITIGMIYKKYYECIFKPTIGKAQKSKLDITLVKKYLEELANSNLITIKKDDKYGNIYELKLPIKVTASIIRNLNEVNKLDQDMLRMADSIR